MTRTVRTRKGTPLRAAGPTIATGDTHSNTTVDNLSVDVSAAGWSQGMRIIGRGIPDGTTIASIAAGGRSITISNAAAASQPGVTFEAIMPHQWVPVGPAVCARGQARGQPRVSGRFRALAVSPDGQRIYAGSALGGVWFSGDAGSRWKALDFYASTNDAGGKPFFSDALTVGAIGVKWGATANDDVVYVGAGEHPLTELKGTKNPDATIQGIGVRVATGPASGIGGPTGPWADPWKVELTDLEGILVNRIFVRQSDGAAWAATSRGLYKRPAGAAVGAAWQKINIGFGDTEISDVVVVMENVAPQIERVYAAAPDGRVARAVDGGVWQAINLPPFIERRNDAPPISAGSVNASRVVTRMRLAVGAELGRVVYALAEGPRLWRIDGDVASRVVGLPDDLFDASTDADKREDAKPPYGMSLAVHPMRDAVAVGGEAYTPPRGLKQAALFVATVTAPRGVGGDWTFPAAAVAGNLPRAEWSGVGIPIGVHALAWTGGANPSLWVAGESGLFSSTNGAAPGSFVQRNSGLGAIESIAFAQSSGSGSVLVLSTPSGTLERINGETWKLSLPGRTGGVAIDPARAYRMYAQVERTIWKVRDLDLDRYESSSAFRGWQPLKFLPDPPSNLDVNGAPYKAWKSALDHEAKNSAPISRAALIATNANGTQIAIGTDRIWYSDDFMKSSRTDVRGGSTVNASATVQITERDVRGNVVNVHELGWRAGMSIEAPGIPLGTSIASIAVDGHSVVISDAAQATNNAAAVRVNERNPGWITLPSGTNPFTGVAPDRKQDVLDGSVLMVRWGSADRLYVLTVTSVYLLERNAGGQWSQRQLYDQIAVEKATKWKTPTGQIPHKLALTSIDVRDANTSPGTLYVGASGDPGEEHVWYYDGAQWVATGLRSTVEDTPVHTVIVDPIDKTIVYVGTDAGVWKGVGVFPAPGGVAPTWTWTHFSTALPEAPCVDLAITTPVDATRRVLRAALAGRGVWEVALDDSILQRPEVYLRAHDVDARWEAVPLGGASDPMAASGRQLRLDASPDVRVARRPPNPPALPGAPAPDPTTLPIGTNSDPYDIWLLISALRASGADLDPDAGWSDRVPTALEDRRVALGVAAAPVLPPKPTAAQRAAWQAATELWHQKLWQAVVGGHRFPYDAIPPDCADLAVHFQDEPDRWPKGALTSCASSNLARVYVSVHSRHWRSIEAATVSVALLMTPYSGRADLVGTEPLPNGWAASLEADRAAAAVPMAPGGALGAWMLRPIPLIQTWFYADQANPFRQVTAGLDPTNPQVLVFDVDLNGGSWERPGWLLLAVILTEDDPLTNTATDVAQVVRTDRHVAARSVRHGATFAEPTRLYAGLDRLVYPTNPSMDALWSRSNVMWTGLYLAPVPAAAPGENPTTQHVNAPPFVSPPAPGVANPFTSGQFIVPVNPVGRPVLGPPFFRGHQNKTWMTVYDDITPHFGVLPIYFGHQDPRNIDPEGTAPVSWRPKGPFDLRESIAVANAEDAATRAVEATIPRGAVIYLDWEVNNLNWVLNDGAGNLVASAARYCRSFFRRLGELGYRVGTYCRPPVAPLLRNDTPGLFVWHVDPPGGPNPPSRVRHLIAGDQLVLDTSNPLVDNHPNTIARQWMLDFTIPAPNPTNVPGGVDFNVSNVQNPAFPERRPLAGRVRGGSVAAMARAVGGCLVCAIRVGKPSVLNWPPVPAAAFKPLVDPGQWWNPFSPIAAVSVFQLAGTQDPEHALLALGYNETEGVGVWRLQTLQRPVLIRDWTHLTIPSAGVVIDPLPGVAACARDDLSIDAFVVDDMTGQIAACRWETAKSAWTVLALLAGAGGAAITVPPVRRTNRLAVTGRDIGGADVFWVGSDVPSWEAFLRRVRVDPGNDGLVYWSSSSAAAPTVWSAAQQIGSATIRVHPLANVAAVSLNPSRIDVLFIGRADRTNPWVLHDFVWNGLNWAVSPDVGNPGGVPRIDLDPHAPLQVCRVDPLTGALFAVGLDGSLYAARFTAAGWAQLVAIGQDTNQGNTHSNQRIDGFAASVRAAGWRVGMRIIGAGIPADTFISAIAANGLSLTISQRAATTANAVGLTVWTDLASVDGATSTGPDDIQVVATGRDGNVYATRWDSVAAAFTAPVERITPLDV